MKLGVICDGISRDLAHAVNVMDEFGLQYAELQFVGDKEIGDHSRQEIAEMDALLLPPEASLGQFPLVHLSEAGGFYIRQGQPVLVPNSPCTGMVRIGLESGEFLGIGEILDDGRVAPRRLIVTQ